ncbi:MAG: hypothetical protein ABIC95_06125 [archaeon]
MNKAILAILFTVGVILYYILALAAGAKSKESKSVMIVAEATKLLGAVIAGYILAGVI